MKASLSWLKDYVDIKLPADNLANILTMAGIPAEHVEKVGNDWCLEFEITANRSDCLSIIGIAREIAAITGKKLKLPKDLKRMAGKKALSSQRLQINIKDKKLCPRYTGRIITGIKVVPSPKWMQEKLVSVGLRPVNNIVDITNFLLMETGQPMHAFDLDKIKGNIEIRKALKGETIKTIDGINQTLEEGMLLIADDKSPIAVAGVMGGIDTEVSRETKNILLESAYFDPISVRRTSRKLKLASESSYRFERKVDFEMVMPASDRAALMINTLAGGKIGKLIDSGSKAVSPISIKFNPEKANVLLGLDIPLKKQKDILKSLDFGVQGKKNILKVKVPSFRRDISQEVDITEEIVRIYGYDKISLTIPKMVGHSKLTDKSDIVKAEIRKYLSSMGLNEIITYNLISEEMLKGFSTGESSIVRLVNPLSREQGILTESLIPGILKAINWNINRKNRDLNLFEIGNVYRSCEKNNVIEEPHLAMAMSGAAETGWLSRKRMISFFDLKGVFVVLTEKLGIEVTFTPTDKIPYFSTAASIRYEDNIIGSVGRLEKEILDKFDIDEDVYLLEISIKDMIKEAVLEKKFRAIPRFPSIMRDISLVCGRDVTAESLLNAMREASSDMVKGITLVDKYAGKQIPEGFQGLLYRIEYRDDSRTLTDKAVEEIHNRIKGNLSSKLGVSFR